MQLLFASCTELAHTWPRASSRVRRSASLPTAHPAPSACVPRSPAMPSTPSLALACRHWHVLVRAIAAAASVQPNSCPGGQEDSILNFEIRSE
jgi:hypothetical protein